MSQVPFLLVGDGPHEPTGLGRIARDLAAYLVASDLPIDLVQVGGDVPPAWVRWRHVPLTRGEDWGASCVEAIWKSLWGDEPGILFVVWDPSRLLPYTTIDVPAQKWAYTAVDAQNLNGRLGGPAAHALSQFDRVLAYGRWGSTILKATLDQPIAYLPHGIFPALWETPATEGEAAWTRSVFGPYARGKTIVGSIMTNQFRKDFATFFLTIRLLLDRGLPVFGWLHTDVPVKAWAVQELVSQLGLEKSVRITVDTYRDRQLAVLYQACGVTVLPSLGEGFGYPIVESLAAGVPIVHGDCAGGAELVPKTEWRVPVRVRRLEGIYALERPVWDVTDWANAIERALSWRKAVGDPVAQAYCRGAVAHLSWEALWPRWYAWVKGGLAA